MEDSNVIVVGLRSLILHDLMEKPVVDEGGSQEESLESVDAFV